ncbi:MAG: sensor histidine kinase, partial [Marmoricola sp.]|nr:sensor histidine kinase [Marmoricola sp.]
MRGPRTLTVRLVVTAVALVAVVSVLIATVATLAIRSQLMDNLDAKVLASVHRAGPDDDRQGGPPLGSNMGPGTLLALVDGTSASQGVVLTEQRGGQKQLSTSALEVLDGVEPDQGVHSVDLPAVGHYRVTAVNAPGGGRLVSGLPTRDVDQTVASMVGYEALLILLGLVAAAGLGMVIVRRQLRPLREVAGTAYEVTREQLSTGEPDISQRVDERLTDPRTEVGQVGYALNTLLDHMSDALAVRHRSEQQVRQFVADASHELRTPLSTIHGYAELSRRTPDDPAALVGAMTKVETETARMSRLVEDMLLLARLDSGRPLESAEVDLTKLLLESVADARVVDSQDRDRHRWQLDLPDEPISVLGDEQRLHQLFTNLLGNARHHTPPGTTITVSARRLGDEAAVEVHDDGPGLPPGLEQHAFERFTRGDTSRTRASGGAGLGLSLVAAIAQ